MMKVLKSAEPRSSGDPHYDLFYGGYIDPEDFVEADDAKRVREAMAVIREFFDTLEENDLMLEC